MGVPLLVITVRHICSPGMAFKMKKQNISFPHGDIFSQGALAVCSDLANFTVAGQFAWGLLLLLSHSPGQVEALAEVEGT